MKGPLGRLLFSREVREEAQVTGAQRCERGVFWNVARCEVATWGVEEKLSQSPAQTQHDGGLLAGPSGQRWSGQLIGLSQA